MSKIISSIASNPIIIISKIMSNTPSNQVTNQREGYIDAIILVVEGVLFAICIGVVAYVIRRWFREELRRKSDAKRNELPQEDRNIIRKLSKFNYTTMHHVTPPVERRGEPPISDNNNIECDSVFDGRDGGIEHDAANRPASSNVTEYDSVASNCSVSGMNTDTGYNSDVRCSQQDILKGSTMSLTSNLQNVVNNLSKLLENTDSETYAFHKSIGNESTRLHDPKLSKLPTLTESSVLY